MLKLYKNIKSRRNELGLTQTDLALALGYSDKSMISRIEKGGIDLPQSKIVEFAKALHTTPSYLMGWEDDDPTEGVTNLIYPSVRPIPILGTICAGNGIWCEDNFDGMFYIDNSVKADLCLKVKGDSMIEAGINDGDYAFIKKDYGFMNGKIYAVRINSDCEAVLKKVNIQGQNIILSPCNCEYEPIVDSCENVSIIGECVGSYHVMK